ncbi:MAG: hypothetical protein LUG99_08080 [Lachnospiraceae bacterium]|nr:hypothetical protein [Lachnospiraceae bacterium]
MNECTALPKKELLIQIQIPFCTGHCHYCERKNLGNSRTLFRQYLKALKAEITDTAPEISDYDVTSIHICGDNTITMMGTDILDEFLLFLKRTIPTADHTQWVIDMLPYEMSAASLTVLRNAHISILHLNTGTCQMKEFNLLKRPYYYAAFDGALSLISMYQQHNISIGLFAGLPGQTEDSLVRSLQYALKAQPVQLSLQACSPDAEAKFSSSVDCLMAQSGLQRYGTGWNYALPGQERIEYTQDSDNMDCIGFGAGAATRLDGNSYHNTENLSLYLAYSTDPQMIACDLKSSDMK